MATKSIILAALIASMTGCAGQLTQTIAVTQCVIADERIGTVVTDPKLALTYLRGMVAEGKGIAEAWKTNPARGGDLSREYLFVEDVLDLVGRLMACIDGDGDGGQVSAAEIADAEWRLAEIRDAAIAAM